MSWLKKIFRQQENTSIKKLVCTTHRGNVRKNNEDNFSFEGEYLPINHQSLDDIWCVQKKDEEHIYVALFDGMGGECAGELASYVAAYSFAEITRESIWEMEDADELTKILNQLICKRAEEEKISQMGTTMILADFGRNGWIANIGDSPAYLYRKNVLQQITVSHTNEALFKECGITNRKPGLTQFLGLSEDEYTLEPHVISLDMQAEDLYLMCSDGLTDMVSEEKIAEILTLEITLEEQVQLLLDEALANGGRDNITIIGCQIG